MPLHLSLSDYDTAFESACAVIDAGGLLIYPTDTLYGIGCDATRAESVAKIRALKGREGSKPFSIMVADLQMLMHYCNVDKEQEKIIHALLPGPYTFILHLKHKLPVSESMEVGIRVPEHNFCRQLSKKCDVPIVTTSANVSGGKDAAEARDVDARISDGAELVIDGGKCLYAQGSTVIDLIRMKVLRKGAVRDGDSFEWEK
jgi:L-threonylcarbamoyladenylate synthase